MTDTTTPASPAPRAAREQAREGFRQAMSWLHTWAGLVLGWLLFAIFLTGTLSFFKTELNLWMRPELHGMPPATADVAERAVAAMNRKVPDVTQWILRMPDERQNAVTLLWRDTGNGRFETLLMNPQTGETVDARKTMGGEFFYRFHYELRTAQKSRWAIEGRWVVGVATMLMFIALLTGVVTHRRIFKDFFTFRPAKGGQRAWLDAHNVTGVLVLPFYLMITFSGLMIFHTLYMPSGIAAAYQGPKGVDSQTYFADLQGEKPERRVRRNPGDKVEPLPAAMPLAAILETARQRWEGGRIGGIQARRDAQGTPVVEVTRHEGDRLQYRPERMLFHGTTGAVLEQTDATTPAAVTYGVLYGLHLGRFAGPGMRWVLVGFGLLGSLMIATGMVLWSVKRSAQDQRKGSAAADGPLRLPFGQRLVASLNIASLAGLPLACAVYMASNRLIPLDAPERPDAELSYFFGAWGVALLWGVLFPNRRGWSLVLALAGAAWAALPLLNALTTSTHLGISLPAGDWLWAGMDLSFLATGALLSWLAWRLRPGRPLPGKAGRKAEVPTRAAAMATPDALPASQA
ncbi:PepSY domain-containing protein [Acidovorax sp. LjRoot118]|uniref:PepSY-associated TM helix domain-containing protein n=1 Tax=Acidovorax sp. LjRoot118 TaxID=3342256 RepID=UPI003ECF8AF8